MREIKNKNFLDFLIATLNHAYETESFELARPPLHIYSKELKIGFYTLINSLKQADSVSMTELFHTVKQLFEDLKENKSLELKRLAILATITEDEMIEEFLDFQKQKLQLDFEVEFWGWETLQNIIKGYKYFLPNASDVEIGTYVNYVPTANIYQLFGYGEVLQQIDNKIDSSLNPVVLHNPLHGTGRTAMALAYAFHYDYQRKFDHFAYVEAVQNLKLDFVLSFDGYAGYLYNPELDLDTNFEILLDYLNKIQGRNLLVIDGIYNTEQASTCLTIANRLNWKILITSKFRIFSFENIYLNHPKPQDAIKIFKYYAPEVDEEKLKVLLEKISYHPFTIVLLAKFYSYFNRQGLDFEQFFEILTKIDKRTFKLNDYLDKSLNKNQLSLQTTILKQIMAIFDYQVKDLTRLERRILLIASVLPSQLVTLKQLRTFVPYGKEEEFQDTVLMLISKGWLEADKGRFRVPSYIRMVLHKKLRPTPTKLRRYLRLLTEKISRLTVESLKWINFAQAFIKSMFQVTVEVADLSLYLADLLDTINLKDQAEDFYRYAAYIYEEIINEYDSEELFQILAQIWKRLGDYHKAMFYAHLLLEAYEAYEEPTIELANTYKLVAEIYFAIGDYNKAVYYTENALDIYSMLLEPDDQRIKNLEQFHKTLTEKLKQISKNKGKNFPGSKK